MKKKWLIAVIIVALLILLALLAFLLLNRPAETPVEPTTPTVGFVEDFGQVDWDLP